MRPSVRDLSAVVRFPEDSNSNNSFVHNFGCYHFMTQIAPRIVKCFQLSVILIPSIRTTRSNS